MTTINEIVRELYKAAACGDLKKVRYYGEWLTELAEEMDEILSESNKDLAELPKTMGTEEN